MPPKKHLTEEDIKIYKEYLEDTTSDVKKYMCKSTIQMYVIQLFETSQAVTSYNSNITLANVNGLKKYIKNWQVIVDMRNDLAHNNYNVKTGVKFYKYVRQYLKKFTYDEYKVLIDVCGASDVYNLILSYCDTRIKEMERNKTHIDCDLPQIIGGGYL